MNADGNDRCILAGALRSHELFESIRGGAALNIASTVSSIPGATAMATLSESWTWSPAPGLTFAAALSAGAEHLFRLNVRGPFDEQLVGAVLAFAREHSTEILSNGGPFVSVSGFSYLGSAFDAVAGVAPAVHNYHDNENVALKEVACTVFPAYRCEFSGTESREEAATRFKRILRPVNLGRGPAPYLKMRYDNPKTQGGSVGDARGFTTADVLVREVRLLENVPAGFVEFENYQRNIYMVNWDGDWVVSSETGQLRFGVDDLIAWVEHILTD